MLIDNAQDTKERSNTYCATVEMKDGKPVNDNGYVKHLRELISAMNKSSDGRSWRVKLRGRGPRKHNGKVYRQELPLGLAETADVYVYETTHYTN